MGCGSLHGSIGESSLGLLFHGLHNDKSGSSNNENGQDNIDPEEDLQGFVVAGHGGLAREFGEKLGPSIISDASIRLGFREDSMMFAVFAVGVGAVPEANGAGNETDNADSNADE